MKVRPLQSSTNTIHNQQSKKPVNRKITNEGNHLTKRSTNPSIKVDTKPKIDGNDLTKKSNPSIKVDAKPKIDENDMTQFVKQSYNPLLDVYSLDEELYQKVLKLELADDGLPSYETSEPFDF